MTDNMKRISLHALSTAIKRWLETLHAPRWRYGVSKASNTSGRRSKQTTLPPALQAPRHKLHAAGSERAMTIARSSRWAHSSIDSKALHVDPSLLKFLDVVVVADRAPPLASTINARKYLSIEDDYMCFRRLHREAGWSVIRRPTLVVRPHATGTLPEIIGLFITAECDARIKYVMADAEAVQNGMMKYLPQVQFSSRARVQARRDNNKWQLAGRGHYAAGKIEVDGLFRFRYARGFGYYRRELAANKDRTYLEKQARLYCGMALMESKHVPIMAEYRASISDRVPSFDGVFPGLSKHLCPASSVGASAGYACDGHNDSSIAGLTETIFWTAPKGMQLPLGESWTFANAEAGLLFDLQHAAAQGGCCMYIPGSVMHNSMPTGCNEHTIHDGMGFVLINKGTILGPATQSWFKENRKTLIL